MQYVPRDDRELTPREKNIIAHALIDYAAEHNLKMLGDDSPEMQASLERVFKRVSERIEQDKKDSQVLPEDRTL